MIRAAEQPASTSVPAWHPRFLTILPTIERQARIAFKHLPAEARQDAVVEVVANATVAFARLVELGKADVAYPSPLARYGIAQVRDNRKVGNHLNVRDVLSEYAQQRKGFVVERLDRYDAEEGTWREAIVEDRRAGPAETAAARIDIAEWFGLLPDRDQKIAAALAVGTSTGDVAKKFRLSPARISQKRCELWASWREFQGEDQAAEAAVA